MAEKKYVVIRHKTTLHAVYASGSPEDGSLWGFHTLCGLEVLDNQKNPDWQEITDDSDVSCKRCAKSIHVLSEPKLTISQKYLLFRLKMGDQVQRDIGNYYSSNWYQQTTNVTVSTKTIDKLLSLGLVSTKHVYKNDQHFEVLTLVSQE